MTNFKTLILIIFINCAVCSFCFGMPERGYSQSLSRMEIEWLHRDYEGENEEVRLSRLEEFVFGTIHEVDFNTRYKNLQKAFDIRKRRQYKHSGKFNNKFSGVPTSVPMNIDNLVND